MGAGAVAGLLTRGLSTVRQSFALVAEGRSIRSLRAAWRVGFRDGTSILGGVATFHPHHVAEARAKDVSLPGGAVTPMKPGVARCVEP